VRVRSREETLLLNIEWFQLAVIRENGQRKSIAKYFKKGPRYLLVHILQGEPELVEELETEFVDIRKQIDLLSKIRKGNVFHGVIGLLLHPR
jgi:hypothetical protein